jgi:hypothetical protein
MSPTSGASARSLDFAGVLSGELGGAAEVTIAEIGVGVSVDVVPRRHAAQPQSGPSLPGQFRAADEGAGQQWITQ